MTIKPIRNDTDHAVALARIEELSWSPKTGQVVKRDSHP